MKVKLLNHTKVIISVLIMMPEYLSL